MDKEIYCRFGDTVFTPAEVEAIAGVSPLLLRTWRQRGFLGDRKYGRASFTAHEIAQIMALQHAAQILKIDLDFAQGPALAAVPSILAFALSDKRAWNVEGTPQQTAAFDRAIKEEDFRGLDYIDRLIGLKKGERRRYLIRDGDGWTPTNDLLGYFSAEESQGAVVLDLLAIGKRMRATVPRPLFTATDIEVRTTRARAREKRRTKRT